MANQWRRDWWWHDADWRWQDATWWWQGANWGQDDNWGQQDANWRQQDANSWQENAAASASGTGPWWAEGGDAAAARWPPATYEIPSAQSS